MSLTREQVERILVKRLGNLLTAADLDGTTADGNNDDLADPLSYALRQCSLTVADVTAPNDDDLSALVAADTDKFLDIAELRTLENVLGNYDGVDIQVGPRRESLGQLRDGLLKRIASKRTDILVNYGVGLADAVIETSKFYGATADADLMWFKGA